VKKSTRAPVVLSALLVCIFGIHLQSNAQETPRFQIEIHASTDRGPSFTLTNLSSKVLTACSLKISTPSEPGKPMRIDWDAPVQGVPPLQPQGSTPLPLPRVVGGDLPDKVEVAAGIWADGETFGEVDWVKVILQTRASRASEYEQTTALLRRGLEQNWTRDAYLSALKSLPFSGSSYGIRSTLEANPQLDGNARLLQQLVQRLLDSLNQKAEALRQAKPSANAATGL
jgi:hypothetical protein